MGTQTSNSFLRLSYCGQLVFNLKLFSADCDTKWKELHIVQYNALIIVTGCAQMASVDDDEEVKIFQVSGHNIFLEKQILANIYLPTDHPNYEMMT